MSEPSGIGTVTEDAHDNQIIPPTNDNNGNELLSQCANCRKAFNSELERFTEIVGKYPKKLCRFDKDDEPEKLAGIGMKIQGRNEEDEAEMNKDFGDPKPPMPMNDFTVGVLEVILTIFGLPLEMDDTDEGVDKLGWNLEGPAAICQKCHGALTSFYKAFQDYVRLLDKASHVSKCVKALYGNQGRLGEGEEEATEVKANVVPKKRGRKPKRRPLNENSVAELLPEVATEVDRKAVQHDIKTEIVMNLDEGGFEADHYGGDELPPSEWDNEPDNYSELASDSFAAPSETDSRPSLRTSPRTRKIKREPEFEAVLHRPRRVAVLEAFEEPAEEKPSSTTKLVKIKSKVPFKKNAKIRTKTTSTSIPGPSQKSKSKTSQVEDKIGTFMCKHCDEKFLSEMRLDKHLATAHQEVSAQGKCTECDHYFSTVATLAKHIHSKHDKKHRCPHPDCQFSCATHPELETHFQGAHDQLLNLCRDCGKSFTSLAYLHRHQRNAHDAEILDSDTDDIFDNDSEENADGGGEPGERLKTAGQAVPSTSGRFQCSQCDKSYKKKHQLSIHMLFHTENEPRYGCSKCHRKYFQPKSLRRHLLIHTMANPLACNECGNIFVRRDHLKRHKETVHNTNRIKKVRKRKDKVRHRCSECDKTFSRKEYLTLHMRIHTGEKPYMCPTCGKTFGDPRNCSQHIITHKNERPFCCSICGLTFKRAHHLNDHEGTHREDIAKPFLCSIPDCGKTFRLRKHLISHELVHKGSRDHACHVCGKAFNRRDNLRQHINKVHGKDMAADALQLLLSQHNPNPVTSTAPSSSVSASLPQDPLKAEEPDPLASIIGTVTPTPTTTVAPLLSFTTLL